MPITWTEYPILPQFLCAVKLHTGEPVIPKLEDMPISDEAQLPQTQQQQQQEDTKPKQLPKGVVLGKDGKPCRSCTSFASWASMTKGQTAPTKTLKTSAPIATMAEAPPPNCPADVEELGRSTWTMLHTMAANYPEQASPVEQEQTKSFMSLFARLYPCSHCAEDFQSWMGQGNEPAVGSRDAFGKWMCNAHNAVNEKLGKGLFDCEKWEERWRTGPPDGSCG